MCLKKEVDLKKVKTQEEIETDKQKKREHHKNILVNTISQKNKNYYQEKKDQIHLKLPRVAMATQKILMDNLILSYTNLNYYKIIIIGLDKTLLTFTYIYLFTRAITIAFISLTT